MTYRNLFNPAKGYEDIRYQFGQKPLSSEWNEEQSIEHNKLFRAFDIYFEPGFIYEGLELVSSTTTTITISNGSAHLDGFGRKFAGQTLDFSMISGDVVPIYAQVYYTEVDQEADVELKHPLQPDLPVARRAKAATLLSVTDPTSGSNPANFLSRVSTQILEYNKITNKLNRTVTNSSRWMNLQNIPGQIKAGQIGKGAIKPEDITVILDGLPLRDALAVRTEDAEGSFIAKGGALIYEDNIISGDNVGVKIRLEAFRAYVVGYQIPVSEDKLFYLDHTNTTAVRNNESKTYQSMVDTYSLSKTPAAVITALDGDVAVIDENVTRGSGNFDNLQNTPVVNATAVTQGMTTYTKDVDWEVVGDQIHWISGSRPTQGTTYQVDYTYRREFVINTDVSLDTDRNSITFIGVTKPVVGSSFQVSYTYYLPRTDILVVDRFATITVLKGTPSDTPQAQPTPDGQLLLGKVEIPPGTQLGNTFLSSNGYVVPSSKSVVYRDLQIIASRMRDHQRRKKTLEDLAFNDSLDAALQYFTTRDATLAKLSVFGDDMYDDRLSDYGRLDQTMIFDSERGLGVNSSTNWIQPQQLDNTSYTNATLLNNNYAILQYTEEVTLSQTKWSDELNLQPYTEIFDARQIVVSNPNLIVGQKFTIKGYNWNFGEDSIEFFVNGQKLTGITIAVGSAGSQSHSVTPAANRNFEVSFTVPANIPIGYRTLSAESYVTGNRAVASLSLQTSAAPLPITNNLVPVYDNRPCNQVRIPPWTDDPNHWREWYNCDTDQWIAYAVKDPVVQTFLVYEDQYITAFDVWFSSKDPYSTMTASLIKTKDGAPDIGRGTLGVATVTPDQIVTNGGPTKFVLDKPVFVAAQETVGIYLESASTGYRVMYAKLGQLDRTMYTENVGDLKTFTSQTGSAIGPMVNVADNLKRDRNTTHRFVTKTFNFTPTTAIDIYAIDAPIYIGPDSTKTLTINQVQTTSDYFGYTVAHGITGALRIQYKTTGTAAAPLVNNGYYYVRALGTATTVLYRTLQDAALDTNRIDLTSVGSGTQTVTVFASALAKWTLTDITAGNAVVWTDNKSILFDVTATNGVFPGAGKFVAKGYESLIQNVQNQFLPSPIALVANHQYQLKVEAVQSADYKFIRDDYPDDGVINAKIYGFPPSVKTYSVITRNTVTDGILFCSPDKMNWFGQPDSDLRFRVYRANFTGHLTTTLTMKQLKDGAGGGEIELDDTFTHFTPFIYGFKPHNTNIALEYSLDGGGTWKLAEPYLFRIGASNNNEDQDRETWAFFNFGFFSQQRFEERQIDPQHFPINPNLRVSTAALSDRIKFRITMSTNNILTSPLLDITNMGIRFEKWGLTTRYYSRTLELDTDGNTASAYFWANIPSGVTFEAAFTTDGDASTPTYLTKTSADATRIVDSANNIIEYKFNYSLSGQSDKRHPKFRVTYTTNNRFNQPLQHRAGFNVFPA